jgi:transposase-like protein
METPRTLQQAIVYFDKVENCNAFMMAARWADAKVRCPSCDSDNVIYLETARLWKCRTKHPRQKFSLKVGTIFEDSALGLDEWLVAIWLIANAKNGISSCELARSLGVTQKSAWHMLHRIRLAMQNGTLNKLSGEVEIDETFIGGLARNHSIRASMRVRAIPCAERLIGSIRRESLDCLASISFPT